MWCGVVWCGVVWCGVVWCGVVKCGVVWCGVVWCGVVWCGVVWCSVVWSGLLQWQWRYEEAFQWDWWNCGSSVSIRLLKLLLRTFRFRCRSVLWDFSSYYLTCLLLDNSHSPVLFYFFLLFCLNSFLNSF